MTKVSFGASSFLASLSLSLCTWGSCIKPQPLQVYQQYCDIQWLIIRTITFISNDNNNILSIRSWQKLLKMPWADTARALTRWQHFLAWNDVKAIIFNIWRQSMNIYLENDPAKFHLDPIWNNGALVLFEDGRWTPRSKKQEQDKQRSVMSSRSNNTNTDSTDDNNDNDTFQFCLTGFWL